MAQAECLPPLRAPRVCVYSWRRVCVRVCASVANSASVRLLQECRPHSKARIGQAYSPPFDPTNPPPPWPRSCSVAPCSALWQPPPARHARPRARAQRRTTSARRRRRLPIEERLLQQLLPRGGLRVAALILRRPLTPQFRALHQADGRRLRERRFLRRRMGGGRLVAVSRITAARRGALHFASAYGNKKVCKCVSVCVPRLATRIATLLECVLYPHSDASNVCDGRVRARVVLDSRVKELARRHACVRDAVRAQRPRFLWHGRGTRPVRYCWHRPCSLGVPVQWCDGLGTQRARSAHRLKMLGGPALMQNCSSFAPCAGGVVARARNNNSKNM